jgi:PhoPQ-activated pathogenicity-related protein
VPNGDHSLGNAFRYARLAGSLSRLHEHVGSGATLPDLRWRFDERPGRLALTVSSDPEPTRVIGWVAHSDARDFRDARWRARRFDRDGDAYEVEVEVPDQGYAAVFGEVAYRDGGLPYFLSTTIRVIGD